MWTATREVDDDIAETLEGQEDNGSASSATRRWDNERRVRDG